MDQERKNPLFVFGPEICISEPSHIFYILFQHASNTWSISTPATPRWPAADGSSDTCARRCRVVSLILPILTPWISFLFFSPPSQNAPQNNANSSNARNNRASTRKSGFFHLYRQSHWVAEKHSHPYYLMVEKWETLGCTAKSGRPCKTSTRTDTLLERIIRFQARDSEKVLLHH